MTVALGIEPGGWQLALEDGGELLLESQRELSADRRPRRLRMSGPLSIDLRSSVLNTSR